MLMPSYYNWLSQDGIVGIGKGLWAGAPRNGCSISSVGMRFFSSPKAFRPTVCPIHSYIQRVPAATLARLKWPGRETTI
jgi:hypothetical protein